MNLSAVDKIQREFRANQQILKLLETSKMLSESLIDRLPIALILVDNNGKILNINRTMREIFGTAEIDILGRPMSSMNFGDLNLRLNEYLDMEAAKELTFDCEIQCNGEKRHFVWQIATVFKSNAHTAIHAISGSDVTTAKGNFEQLKEIKQDLELAETVQNLLLPQKKSMDFDNCKSAYFYEPSTKVGGDYVFRETLKDGSELFLIADVMGHGIASAMVTAVLAGTITTVTKLEKEIGQDSIVDMLSHLHETMVTVCKGQFLVSLAAIHFKKETGKLELFGAGFPSVFIQVNGEITSKNLRGNPLGLKDFPFSIGRYSLELASRSRILLYTDGCYEFSCADGSSFSKKRLRQFFSETGSMNFPDILPYLSRSLKEVRGGPENPDDQTFLVFEIA